MSSWNNRLWNVIFALALLLCQFQVFAMAKDEDTGRVCPPYTRFATVNHAPFSKGPLALPFQRPHASCRTFETESVQRVIDDLNSKMIDADLARLFENAFPNTLDTTIQYFDDGRGSQALLKQTTGRDLWGEESWQGRGPWSFIVTGDINAEWLRDSTSQLQGYQKLASKDKKLSDLLLGAINTQVEYVITNPYANAFQPPPPSGLKPQPGQQDDVHPAYEPNAVFEAKYELDSLAHFLRLANEYHRHTGRTEFMTKRWYLALKKVKQVLEEQSQATFDPTTGKLVQNEYRFLRMTNIGSETLNLGGSGNPLAGGTGLVRSAFRPSDDATIFPFLIPANAMMSVELARTATLLEEKGDDAALAKDFLARSEAIRNGIYEHGVVEHKTFGKVFAYEVDGYGSHLMMDDANVPSLLALPLLGFVFASDETYQNTRKMILSRAGNPYYLEGSDFSGIGGPHIGLSYAWPISRLIQAMTSDNDEEIMHCIDSVKKVSHLGLIHESVNVENDFSYTRSWFAWANSVFAQTILDIAHRKPHLIFGDGADPYILD